LQAGGRGFESRTLHLLNHAVSAWLRRFRALVELTASAAQRRSRPLFSSSTGANTGANRAARSSALGRARRGCDRPRSGRLGPEVESRGGVRQLLDVRNVVAVLRPSGPIPVPVRCDERQRRSGRGRPSRLRFEGLKLCDEIRVLVARLEHFLREGDSDLDLLLADLVEVPRLDVCCIVPE
jgi:hypothetical protein